MFEAARLTDPIAHSSALAGFLVGALIGIALIAAVAFATCTCGFGVALLAGLAAGVGASLILGIGEAIGKSFMSPAGTITSGSPTVFTNSRPAAFAKASTVLCDKHSPVPLVAEGSTNVFINGFAAARKKDHTTCGAEIDDGSSNVFIGGGTKAYLPVADEVPPWLRTTVDWAFALAGLAGGLGGMLKAAGGLSRAVLPCAAKFIAGYVAGEAVGRYVAAPIISRVMGGLLGNPVEVATGRKVLLAQHEIDAVVQSPIPLVCARFYASDLAFEGSLGKGWVLPWDLRLQQRDGRIWFADGQGRETGFPLVQPGHCAYSDAEQCYLSCTATGQFILYDLNEVYHDFGQLDPGGAIAWVRRREDRTGQWHSYLRDDAGRVSTIRTSGGQQLQLHYVDAPSRLTTIDCTDGGTPGTLVGYGYDGTGQLVSVTDANGAVARRFSYLDGRMASHTNALGLVCTYEWAEIDGAARVVACRTSEGDHTSFRYDREARQTWAQDEQGRTAHWQYDAQFQITACTDFDGASYRIAFNDAGMPQVVSLPGERAVAFEYDHAARIIAETDPLGRVTRTSYDTNSLRISELILPDGSRWRAEYDYLGRLLATTDPLGREERNEYADGLSPWPVAHIDAGGGRRQMEWTRRGQMTSHTDCSGKVTRYQYNADGQLASLTDALGQTTRYHYLRTGEPTQVVLADGSTEQFAYDAAGLLVEQRGAGQQPRRWVRNARGQVLDVIDPAQHHLRYRYDVRGRVVELARGEGARYRFEYDAGDRLAREVRPDGAERRMRYDPAGELQEIEKIGAAPGQAARRTVVYERDKAGRMLAQTTATATTRYTWDDGDHLLEAASEPNADGAALGVAAGAVRFEYDAAGRMVAEHGAEGTVGYGLDALDNLVSLALPHGQRIDMLTYGSGHVHQIRCAGQVICDFERDDLHREVERTQGRLTQRIGYDVLGRRASQTAGSTPELAAAQARLWRSYRYHPSGDLAEQRDSVRGAIDFQYDAVGQLQRQTRHADQQQERFVWDAAGNLLQDAGEKSRGQVEGNRLKVWQDLRFEYDAWGNLVTKRKGAHQVQRFSFDAEDRLVSVVTENPHGVSETRMAYDPLGRRIATTETRAQAGGRARTAVKRFVWQGLRMVQERRENAVSSYVFSPDATYTPLARVDAVIAAAATAAAIATAQNTARVYHFHTDLVGAPLEMTDDAGELAWAGTYQAWGKLGTDDDVALPGAIDQPLRYPGQYADEGTGLHYNTFRFYDPDIGRFISPDPIGLAGGDNLYAYAPNPSGWMDPWGLMPWVDPVNVGHHLVPQSLARSTGPSLVATLFGSNTQTPTFFFSKPYVSGSHEAIHAAQKPFVGRLTGSWSGKPMDLVRAAGKGLDAVSHIRGDLKIPATGEVIAHNVTPRQAFSALLTWGRKQAMPPRPPSGGC
ncbi:DUF6531 domain-containing protein [Massilia sp. P8910]|uniref:RHS repeat-associated core domain-containing protein n=1 Tax=Massilia antarctica TaxID=2765360 RepID=UPI001E63ADF7|nr:RHS repeat-associated core domain-containing protein [Massilia antarctica]MCE3606593.1 DUF6531 domain-containing protein [Massilia antarctica]